MHEVSLMAEVLAVVTDSAKERNLQQIHKVKLVVGEHASVMPDSLQFAFMLLKKAPLSDTAVLKIERAGGDEFYIDYIEGE